MYCINKLIMDYNQFTYYRANPFSNQGYIPPVAHTNRHKPNFLVQMPTGEQHLDKIGKRQYMNGIRRSNIGQQNLLSSPQKYPYEHRIALDKAYERNLNTIDIEGASSNSFVSSAVKNKWKAQEELARNHKDHDEYKSRQLTEEDKRRLIAGSHYQKIQKMSHSDLHSNQKRQSELFQNNQRQIMRNQHKNPVQVMTSLPRHQSIDVNSARVFNPEDQNQKKTQEKHQIRLKMQNEESINRQKDQFNQQKRQLPKLQNNPREEDQKKVQNIQQDSSKVSGLESGNHEKANELISRYPYEANRVATQDLIKKRQAQNTPTPDWREIKMQNRMLNPTNLSWESNSIYLAGRNLLGR